MFPSAEIIQAPEARELYYNGNPQELITAGTASNGTMMYLVTTSYSEDEDAPEDQAGWTSDIPTRTDIGLYYVWYKAVGNENYTDSAPEMIPVRIEKGTATITQTPSARNLTYTGQPQELVNEGTADGGTILYALGTVATAPEADAENIPEEQKKWSTSIPTATNAGTYYVWYKVVGDSTHTDSTPACVTVTIGEKIVYTAAETSATVAEHTIGSGKDAVLVFHRSVDDANTIHHFTSAAVDGKTLSTREYTVKSGSLILTLKASYLDTLTPGTHRVTATFDDGTADTTIRILEAPLTPANVPKTGDGANLGLWLTLMLSGLLLLGGWSVYTIRKRG